MLFDDGAHGDGAANDNIFANTITITRKAAGLYVDAQVTDNLQMTQTFERVLDNLTTAGPIDLDAFEIFSDNLNNDYKANPGENVRYGLRVRNQTTFSFSNLRLIDRAVLKNHVYEITGVDSINAENERGLSLRNLTENRFLLRHHPLHDFLGHNMPLLDGFKILRGTIPDQSLAGMMDWAIPNGVRVWTWSNASTLGFEGFNGALGWNEPRNVFGPGGKTIKASALRNTLIKFAATDAAGNVLDANDPNWSFGHRYGRGFNNAPALPEFAPFIVNPASGYAYQDYKRSVPFSAWNVESDPPRRLMIGHLENNVAGGSVDGRYWPPYSGNASNTSSAGPREWFFIFDVTYSETPDMRLAVDLINNPAPVMWWGTPARRNNGGFSAGNEFLIIALHVITEQDRLVFNPTTVDVAEQSGPLTFAGKSGRQRFIFLSFGGQRPHECFRVALCANAQNDFVAISQSFSETTLFTVLNFEKGVIKISCCTNPDSSGSIASKLHIIFLISTMPSSTTPELVLASTSPYRRELMSRLGLPFRAVVPRFEEMHEHEGDPAALALALARGKAMSLAADFDNAIIIGSDQVVWFDGHVLGKPGTQDRAWQELRALRGHTHEFYMGLFLYHTARKAAQEFVVPGSAKLRADLRDEELRRYVEMDNPLDCAGSAKTEGPGLMLFERLDCEDWTAIIGLPVIALTTALRQWGYPLLGPS